MSLHESLVPDGQSGHSGVRHIHVTLGHLLPGNVEEVLGQDHLQVGPVRLRQARRVPQTGVPGHPGKPQRQTQDQCDNPHGRALRTVLEGQTASPHSLVIAGPTVHCVGHNNHAVHHRLQSLIQSSHRDLSSRIHTHLRLNNRIIDGRTHQSGCHIDLRPLLHQAGLLPDRERASQNSVRVRQLANLENVPIPICQLLLVHILHRLFQGHIHWSPWPGDLSDPRRMSSW